jgi:PAS domain S-box-containing protein
MRLSRRHRDSSLATRVTFGAMAAIALLAAALAWFVVHKDREAFLADRGVSLANRIERNLGLLERSVGDLRRDVLFLSRTPPVQGVVRAVRNNGVDPVEGISGGAWARRLKDIFAAFAGARGDFYQIRLIGAADNGRELVRVDVREGRPVATPPEGLQAKGDRDYYRATMLLKAGDVHLSGIDLNREHGRVEMPHVRTLRAATPVFTPTGERFGMIAINLALGPQIDFATGNLPPDVRAWLMNDRGDFLAHPEPGRSFGFDLGQRYTWQQEMPGLQALLDSPGDGRALRPVQTSAGLMHMMAERLHFDPQQPERFLLLAYGVPGAVVAERSARIRNVAAASAAGIALLIGAIVFLLLRRAFGPLTQLAAAAGSIGEGRYDAALPETAAGEVGVLVRAFAGMKSRIAAREQEIRRANDEVRVSEARLRTIVENLDEGVAVADLDGRLLHFNRAAIAMHGFSGPDEYLRALPEFAETFELSGPDGAPWPVEQWPLARILRGENLRDLETHIRRKRNGWQRIFSYGGALARDAGNQPLLAVITIRDITERKQAETRVREQKARAEALLESAPDPIVIVDWKGRIAVLNAQAQRAFGYSREELLGQPIEALVPERLRAVHAAQRAPYQEEPRARVMGAERELLARRKDGSEFAVDVRLSPLETAEGTLVISTIRDITERKQAERRIHLQLEHLGLLDQITRSIGERQDLKSIFQVVVRSLEDRLPIDFGCVCLHDAAAGRLTVTCVGAASEPLARELTMGEQAAIDVDENGLGRCIGGQLVYEPDIAAVRFPFPERLARGGLRSLVMAPLRSESRVFGVLVAARREAEAFGSVECEFLRQLSEHVALAASQAQLHGALQQAYDDLRQTQQAVMQQERLRALGQMASGIAHDINNALSPVSLYAESLLETEPGLSARARGYLETIQRAVDDVSQTVARMREFYRQREVQLELAPVDVNQLVRQVLDLTRARWSDMPLQRGVVVRERIDLAPDAPRIMGVESEIREALTNLVFNAVDAMPEGGALTLRTRLVATAQDGDPESVVIEVADEGVGMDAETRRRCLEPFFTTKGERGTGLGLAMVFGVAQRHSAELEIDSAPGSGTTVRLVFAAPAALSAEPAAAAAAPSEVKARLRLLLVDDDPVLLKSLRDALETDGHAVLAASGGEDGIAVFRASLERAEPIDAVITDLGMPYVDGRRVAAAVKEASPATPVILLTGWGRRLVTDGEIPSHVDRVLAKPPKLREVREALAQLCRIEPRAP